MKMQQIVRISFSFVFLSFFVLCDNVALDIPKGDACYQRDARRYLRSTIKIKRILFCIVLT